MYKLRGKEKEQVAQEMILCLQPPRAHRGSHRIDSRENKEDFCPYPTLPSDLVKNVNRGPVDRECRGAGGYVRRWHGDAAESPPSKKQQGSEKQEPANR